MNDFGQALQTASPFLLGLGAQLQGRDPDGLSKGLAKMQEEAQAAQRKSAISDLIGSMGIGGNKAALLDMLPFDQQAAMLMQEQQRMDEDAQFNNVWGTLYGGGGGYSDMSAPRMGGVASGPLNPTPGDPNYVAPEDLKPAFAAAEDQFGLPAGYLTRTAQIESGFNPNAKNPKSSATGLFQFIGSTAKEYGLENPRDPMASTQAAARLAADNANVLRRALGREPSAAELYLAHQQGAGGAARLLSNPNARAADVVGADAVRLNGGSLDMTAGQFANKWMKKFGGQPKDDNVTRKALIKAMQNPQLADWAAMEYQQRFGGAEEKTRVLSQQEAAQMGLPPGAYQMKPDGTISAIGGGGQTINVNTGAENRQWGEPPKDHVWALDETGSVATRPVDVGGRTVMQPVAVPIGTPQSDQEAAASQARRGVALSQEMQAADNVLDAISGAETILDGRGLGSSIIPEAGIIGSRLADWGLNQEAVDLKNTMATIESNVAFDRLQKMRESSPTGGALGAVSERELTLLSSSIANLQNSTSEPELRKNLAKVKEIYSRIIAKAQLYDNAGDFGFGMNVGVYTPQFIETMPRDALDKLPIEQMTDEQLAAIEKRLQ